MRFSPCGRPSFSCEFEFILSCACRLFRVRHQSKPSLVPKHQGNLFRVSFLFATPAKKVHLPASFPTLAYGPPSAFLTLSTGYASLHLAGLFHPAATYGIHLSGVLSAAQRARLVGDLCPLVVGVFRLPAGCPPGANSKHLAFRALFQTTTRC
jgi:hypothetical protein